MQRNLTHWMDPGARFHSEFGTVTGLEWCTAEAARINASGAVVRVVAS